MIRMRAVSTNLGTPVQNTVRAPELLKFSQNKNQIHTGLKLH
jgi:hypothetical protein